MENNITISKSELDLAIEAIDPEGPESQFFLADGSHIGTHLLNGRDEEFHAAQHIVLVRRYEEPRSLVGVHLLLPIDDDSRQPYRLVTLGLYAINKAVSLMHLAYDQGRCIEDSFAIGSEIDSDLSRYIGAQVIPLEFKQGWAACRRETWDRVSTVSLWTA